MDWLIKEQSRLPPVWPRELPAEGTPEFWFIACKFEMSTRDSVSEKMRSLAVGGAVELPTPLEAWMFRRRFEWAGQLAIAKVEEGVEPEVPLAELLEWALVRTWETDGCIAMWNHAERGGKPHPENPDGLSPLK